MIALFATLCGCGGANRTKRDDKSQIFVSIAPLRPLVTAITGEDFDVEILVPTEASPESFELTPRQFISLHDAQMILAIGLIDFERNMLSKVDEGRVVDLSHGIELIAGSCSHHHHGHHCAHGVDPHVWTSPKALKIMAQNAYKAISTA